MTTLDEVTRKKAAAFAEQQTAVEAAGPGNIGNDTRAKPVLTDTAGAVKIDVPRDREATFKPQIVKNPNPRSSKNAWMGQIARTSNRTCAVQPTAPGCLTLVEVTSI